MPKARKANRASWLFHDKPALVLTTDFDDEAYDRFGVFIKYDESTAQGSLAIQCSIQLDGLEGYESSQPFSILVRPETIEAIHLDDCLESSEIKLPAMLTKIPDISVTNATDVLLLSLTLRSPGRVICPMIPLPIHPKVPTQHHFVVFSRLCQATHIRIYVGKKQVLQNQQSRLQQFVEAVAKGNLRAPPIDLRCLGGGKGAQESEWIDVHPASVVRSEKTGFYNPRKRPRNVSGSPLPEELFVKRLLQDVPASPTEVNTPSTIGRTPSCNETSPRPGQKIPSTVTRTSNRDTPDREDTPLPQYSDSSTASPRDPLPYGAGLRQKASHNSDIKPSNFHTRPDKPPASDLISSLGGVLQQMLPKIIEGAFESVLAPLIDARLEDLVNRKLQAIVNENLPTLTNDALEENMDRFLSNVEDGNVRAEAEFAETVDVAKIELHETRDYCVKEIESFVQQRLVDLDHEVDVVTTNAVETIEDKVFDAKKCFDEYRRSVKMAAPRIQHTRGTVRRKSV